MMFKNGGDLTNLTVILHQVSFAYFFAQIVPILLVSKSPSLRGLVGVFCSGILTVDKNFLGSYKVSSMNHSHFEKRNVSSID